jgi:hypothetical protein
MQAFVPSAEGSSSLSSPSDGNDDHDDNDDEEQEEEEEEDEPPQPVEPSQPSQPSQPSPPAARHIPYKSHWDNIPDILLNPPPFVMEHASDPMLQIPLDKQFTMDATSKCWRSIPNDADSLLQHEPDGITWAICEECVTQIPIQIQKAIYFFHSFWTHIQDYAGYAVESRSIGFKTLRNKPKVVMRLVWKVLELAASEYQDNDDDDDLDMTTLMQQRGVQQDGVRECEIPPLKIRLAFTGVKFVNPEGVAEKRVFAVLLVTFARNFDALEYIKQVLLKEPSHSETNAQKKMDFYTEMKMIWKEMVRFVAFQNLGLDETKLHAVNDHLDDPGGELGVDSLLNMYQIPMQIYGAVKNSLIKTRIQQNEGVHFSNMRQARNSIHISDFEIVGMPKLPFRMTAQMGDYIKYMHNYINCMVKGREEVANKIVASMAAKKSKKTSNEDDADEPAEDGEAEEEGKDLMCLAGWPLQEDDQGVVNAWGLPRLPLYLDFRPEFSPELSSRFPMWIVDAGGPNGIPEVIKACLRFFLVSTPEDSPSTMHWEHFLHDRRIANPSLVLQKYYGEKADPMSALMVSGYLRQWWESLVRDFQTQRSPELPTGRHANVSTLFDKYNRYIRSVVLHHESSVLCNAFRSERVTQGMFIIHTLDWKTISSHGADSIREQMKGARANMSHTLRHDLYMVTNELFWRTWETLNHSFRMNSSNLAFLVEMMVSQVFWMMGEHNKTWPAYFQGIQIKAGNGHFRLTTKDGTVDDNRKPNSSGMDWTHARMNDLFHVIAERAGISNPKHDLQTPANCTGWTPASFPLLTSATLVNDKIDSMPPESIMLRSFIATEVRDVAIGPLIGNFPRNAEGTDQVKFNTCDPDGSNKRRARIQAKVESLHILSMASNVIARNPTENEQYRTINVVVHSMAPGFVPYVKRQRTGGFNNQTCNAFGGRQSRPERMQAIANVLSYANIWVSCTTALINKSAAVPCEINPAVLSYLDWLFFYVHEHVGGMLDRLVFQSFQRMKEGYEARQVAKSVWTAAIHDISASTTSQEAVMRHLKRVHIHALPITEAPAAAHSFLTRGIHMGATIMVGIAARHLQAPLITLKDLLAFFAPRVEGAPETERERMCTSNLRNWMQYNVGMYRFCVDETNQKTCYITSSGDLNGDPIDEKECILRVKRAMVQHENVYQAIGAQIKSTNGRELFDTCHMGPESSIYGNAIQSMVQDYAPDFRQLFSPHLYNSKQHLHKLGLLSAFPGIDNWREEGETPPFARVFASHDANGNVSSYSVGINVWSMLLIASMGGTMLNPHAPSNLAHSLLRQILNNAPEAATPGNTCMVREFQIDNTSPQRILLSARGRPLHFMRPVGDINFATTGTFTYGKAIDNFLPEDIMHCGFLFSLAKLFNCHILDLPGHVVSAHYEVRPNTMYAIWHAIGRRVGNLYVNSAQQRVDVYDHDNNSAFSWAIDEWQAKLVEHDYIILPMFFRYGVCVHHGDEENGTLGLIVPHSAEGSLYDPEDGGYRYITDVSAEKHKIGCIDALTKMIPTGTPVFLDWRARRAPPSRLASPTSTGGARTC